MWGTEQTSSGAHQKAGAQGETTEKPGHCRRKKLSGRAAVARSVFDRVRNLRIQLLGGIGEGLVAKRGARTAPYVGTFRISYVVLRDVAEANHLLRHWFAGRQWGSHTLSLVVSFTGFRVFGSRLVLSNPDESCGIR
jgi:hypothetical protein